MQGINGKAWTGNESGEVDPDSQLLPDPETLEADDEDRWEDAEVDFLGGLLMGGAEPKVRQGWHLSNTRSRSSDSELESPERA